MFVKTITYKDLDGNDVTEDFYFHLTKPEILKLEVSFQGGMEAHLKKIVRTLDGAELVKAFDMFLSASFGRRDEGGKRFIKKPEFWKEFQETNAYEVLFMELLTDANKSAEFVSQLFPADVMAQLKAEVNGETPTQVTAFDPPATGNARPKRQPESREELLAKFKAKVQAKTETDYTGWSEDELMALPDDDLATALEQRAAKGL